MHLSWFRPEGLTIARRLGAMVGYCWTKRHSDSVGEIYVIAVHPAAVGQGVGRALLRRGMELLSEAGCQKAIVYVDGANERAIALYASEGFTLNRTERVLELQLSD
jgi:mycothiol synthase